MLPWIAYAGTIKVTSTPVLTNTAICAISVNPGDQPRTGCGAGMWDRSQHRWPHGWSIERGRSIKIAA